MSYERLMHEHGLIEVAMKKLQGLVAGTPADVSAVVIALADLSQELGSHLAHEDSFIYPRMIQGSNPLMRDAANAFAAEFASLRVDWSVYLLEWSAECIAADWGNFAHQTDAMLDRLQRRVDAENNILYTVALRESAVTLRDRAA